MIEISVRDMINSTRALKRLNSTDMTIKIAYQLARIIREINNELKNFQDAKMRLVEKYAKRDENNNFIKDENENIMIIPEKATQFQLESEALLNTTININCEPVLISDFNDIQSTPEEIMVLLPFLINN